jgi:hypothetical protein
VNDGGSIGKKLPSSSGRFPAVCGAFSIGIRQWPGPAGRGQRSIHQVNRKVEPVYLAGIGDRAHSARSFGNCDAEYKEFMHARATATPYSNAAAPW